MLKTSTKALSALAAERAERSDIGSTAIWHYSVENPKAKILMIHGFRGTHLGLTPQCGALAKFHVAIPDLPGYGKSHEFTDEHSLENYGLWLKNLVNNLGEDWIVLGHSFGSLVVANALGQGMRPKAVILQNPITTRASDNQSVANTVADSFYKFCAATGWFGSALLRSAVIVRMMSIAMTTTSNLQLRSWIHGQHHKYFSSYRADRVAFEGYQAAAAGNVLDYLADFSSPTLLIAGEKDIIAPLANQIVAQQKMASAELTVIEKVGHLTHYETPIEVAEAIEEFVGKL